MNCSKNSELKRKRKIKSDLKMIIQEPANMANLWKNKRRTTLFGFEVKA